MREESRSNRDSINQWTEVLSTPEIPKWLRAQSLSGVKRFFFVSFFLGLALLILGRSAPTALEMRYQSIGVIVGGWSFDLIGWEIKAISEKLGALARPRPALSAEEESALVQEYIESAHRLGDLERQINELLSLDPDGDGAEQRALQTEVADLRTLQAARRPHVEMIIQDQVSTELAAAGFGFGGPFPPVWFTFVEPPKKLVVSPRDRITTVYSRMLTEGIDPAEAEAGEVAIRDATDLSAYITNIGGLGAYPSMVVDRASLSWVMSTVAHEWVHNYLTLFPLGLRYGINSELTIINETVADIVGDEIGERVVARYYPEFLPQEAPLPSAAAGGEVLPVAHEYPESFSFRREMRETRLRVDGLLAAGLVDAAERYMEARRRFFVANGYPLRVLNQAYFAFHGSYGTSAASTSPLGPKLQALRDQSGDLSTFLRTVRWFTGAEDVDRALESQGSGIRDQGSGVPTRSLIPSPRSPVPGPRP
jgi:hypothetical protein